VQVLCMYVRARRGCFPLGWGTINNYTAVLTDGEGERKSEVVQMSNEVNHFSRDKLLSIELYYVMHVFLTHSALSQAPFIRALLASTSCHLTSLFS
jgi:hypothetical protein